VTSNSRYFLACAAYRFGHIERGYRSLFRARGRLYCFGVRAIDNAEREILVGAYGLTTGSGIVEALVRANQRGVDVRLIVDKTTPCPAASRIAPPWPPQACRSGSTLRHGSRTPKRW
jgi:phospholipase D-like protein